MINKNQSSFKNNIASCFSYLRNRKIGILGGSFNPAHDGHIHISQIAKLSLGLDEVWWLVAPQNRLKSSFGMEKFRKRLNQARKLTANHNFIRVLDIEEKNNLFMSYKTVLFLTNKSRNAKFIWLMGSDILKSFNKWINPSKITKKMHIAVIQRPGYSKFIINGKDLIFLGKKLNSSKSKLLYLQKKPKWVFLKKKLLAISSTKIRYLNSINQIGL